MPSSRPSIAVLGLGRMGRPMAARLLAAGYPVTVWNRTASRADDLRGARARVAATPADAARDADVVITMPADPAAVERVLFGDGGALAAMREGATLIDCSTVGPEDSRATAANCARHGVRFVDAPVLGSVPAAEQGTLTVLAGGDASVVGEMEPILKVLGQRVIRAGGTGMGSALKLVMNLLVGGLTELMAESFVLADGAGLSKEVVRETLMTSVLHSPFVGYKAPQLLDRQFSPLFTTALMLKDLDLALHLAGDLGLRLPATRTIRDVYDHSAQHGRADQDFSAVIDQVAGARS